MMRVVLMTLATLYAHSLVVDAVNPIRKIVNLMKDMQKEIEAEGAKEKVLFDKFMCFCGDSSGSLERSIDDSKSKIEELSAKLKSDTAEKAQLKMDVAQHKKDREGAINDAAQAANLRKKENGEYNSMVADAKANIAAMSSAIPALEKGLGGASLMQLPHYDVIHRLIQTYPNLDSLARRDAIAFFEQSGDYIPQSGQIVGILSQMKETMAADLQQAMREEEQAAGSFSTLKSSKEREAKLLEQSIQTKMQRSGNLAISAQQAKDALLDEQDELIDNQKFFNDLESQCGTKQKQWDERCKMRNDEVAAVSEAISILTEDGAMDTFKKTLPSASLMSMTPGQSGAGFLQRKGDDDTSPIEQSKSVIAGIANRDGNPQFKLMLFSLNSKLKLLDDNTNSTAQGDEPAKPASKGSALALVSKIVKGMIATLNQQQEADDKQKAFCDTEFGRANEQASGAKSKVADLDASVNEMSDSVAQLADQIKPLKEQIMAVDRAVAEATEQRKEEHSEYASELQMNKMAEKLVGKARNRLRKFYAPTLYKQSSTQMIQEHSAQPMSAEEKLLTAGVGALSFMQWRQAQAPPTFSGSVKKNKASAGILGMMDTIIKDLEMSSQEAEMDENSTQKDYNKLMANSQTSRAQYAKSVTDKEAAKAVLETKLLTIKESHRDASEDLVIVQGYLNDLHIQCDQLMDNYEARKEARVAEIKALNENAGMLEGAQKEHAMAKFDVA